MPSQATKTTKVPTNPNFGDPLSSTDKILIGVFVPVGVLTSAGAAYFVYVRLFKSPSTVAPSSDTDIDLENQSEPRPSQSESPPPNDDQDSVDQEPTDRLTVDQNDQKAEEINNETVQ